jgi:hypothetical protein
MASWTSWSGASSGTAARRDLGSRSIPCRNRERAGQDTPGLGQWPFARHTSSSRVVRRGRLHLVNHNQTVARVIWPEVDRYRLPKRSAEKVHRPLGFSLLLGKVASPWCYYPAPHCCKGQAELEEGGKRRKGPADHDVVMLSMSFYPSEILGTHRQHIHPFQLETLHQVLQEGGLFPDGIEQCQMDCGLSQFQWQAGKASPAADVNNGGIPPFLQQVRQSK